MSRRIAFVCAASIPFLLSHISYGQTWATTPASFNPDSALQYILEKIEGTPLSLLQAVESAAQHATSVRSAEAAYRAAQGASRREAGMFDPEVFFTMNYADQETPTASFFAGAPTLATKQTTAHGGLRMLLPVGTSVEVSLNTIRLETKTDATLLPCCLATLPPSPYHLTESCTIPRVPKGSNSRTNVNNSPPSAQ